MNERDLQPTGSEIRKRAMELCRLTDGSPCAGPETDCEPSNCRAMEQAKREITAECEHGYRTPVICPQCDPAVYERGVHRSNG